MQKTPNILFLMCDQLTANVLSCYGGPVSAPNINRLAQRGMVFETAYCANPVCSPSRASIITGQYPHRHGLVHNTRKQVYPEGPAARTPDSPTAEGLLHDAGYRTTHAGKWHISGPVDLACYPTMYREDMEYHAELQPFFDSVESSGKPYMDWYNWRLPVDINPAYKTAVDAVPKEKMAPGESPAPGFHRTMGVLEMPLEDMFEYRMATRTIEAIQQADGPFMATCSFVLPHDPNAVPREYYNAVPDFELPGGSIDPLYHKEFSCAFPRDAGPDFLREFRRIYLASCMLVDDQVGRILDALDASGKAEDTVIIFTADHGEFTAQRGCFWKNTWSFYDEVATVPLIFAGPGIQQGRYNGIVELVDLMPTILDVCGLPIPAETDGVSLKPVLQGGSIDKDQAMCVRLFMPPDGRLRPHTCDDREHFMLRDGHYKYFYHNDPFGGLVGRVLYNLEDDPGEENNLIESEPGKAAEMQEKLRVKLAGTGYTLNEKLT